MEDPSLLRLFRLYRLVVPGDDDRFLVDGLICGTCGLLFGIGEPADPREEITAYCSDECFDAALTIKP